MPQRGTASTRGRVTLEVKDMFLSPKFGKCWGINEHTCNQGFRQEVACNFLPLTFSPTPLPQNFIITITLSKFGGPMCWKRTLANTYVTFNQCKVKGQTSPSPPEENLVWNLDSTLNSTAFYLTEIQRESVHLYLFHEEIIPIPGVDRMLYFIKHNNDVSSCVTWFLGTQKMSLTAIGQQNWLK